MYTNNFVMAIYNIVICYDILYNLGRERETQRPE